MKFYLWTFLVVITGCSAPNHPYYATEMSDLVKSQAQFQAQHQVQFVKREIQALPFLLTSYERINAKGSIANIYIEGDGRAWLSKRRPSRDPTPKNPVAFQLAQLDNSDNVIYLARPCQYTKTVDGSACDQKYWTSHRFAPEVIDAMNSSLNNLKQRHKIKSFNLVGFSGGGNIATLLAARRADILSVRTVAGNVDHQLQTRIHNVSPMPYSLNAKNIARKISHIPQIHFVGSRDKIVPVDVARSYKAASQSSCVKIHLVDGVRHIEGWKSVWKSLLRQSLDCDEL